MCKALTFKLFYPLVKYEFWIIEFIVGFAFGFYAEALFAGAQGEFVGLDQCNVRLAPSLAGSGDISIALTVDGKTSNTVKARIK